MAPASTSPQCTEDAHNNSRNARLDDTVQFRIGNLFEADIRPVRVVTLYLLLHANPKLDSCVCEQSKVSTRLVSHDFNMGKDCPRDRRERHTTRPSITGITEMGKARVKR